MLGTRVVAAVARRRYRVRLASRQPGVDAANAVDASSTSFLCAVRVRAPCTVLWRAPTTSRGLGAAGGPGGRLETGERRRLCQPVVVTMSDTARIAPRHASAAMSLSFRST